MALSFNRTAIPKMNIGTYNASNATTDISVTNADHEDYENYAGEETDIDTSNRPVFEQTSDDFEEVSSNDTNALVTVGSSIAMGAVALTNGVANVGEDLVDAAAIVTTGVASIFTGLTDGVSYALTGEDLGLTDAMWANTRAFVEEDHVDNFYEDLCTNGPLSGVNENAVDWMQYGGTGYEISEQLGYIAGTVALGVATGGAGSTSGLASIAKTAGKSAAEFAFFEGIGYGTEEAWQEGAGTYEGLGAGLETGTWDALQYYLGTAMAGKGVLAVASDTTLGGLDTIVRSGIGANATDQDFSDVFDENGGWGSVALGATLGGGLGALGEFGMGSNKNVDVDGVESNVKNLDTATSSNIEVDTSTLTAEELTEWADTTMREKLRAELGDYVDASKFDSLDGTYKFVSGDELKELTGRENLNGYNDGKVNVINSEKDAFNVKATTIHESIHHLSNGPGSMTSTTVTARSGVQVVTLDRETMTRTRRNEGLNEAFTELLAERTMKEEYPAVRRSAYVQAVDRLKQLESSGVVDYDTIKSSYFKNDEATIRNVINSVAGDDTYFDSVFSPTFDKAIRSTEGVAELDEVVRYLAMQAS